VRTSSEVGSMGMMYACSDGNAIECDLVRKRMSARAWEYADEREKGVLSVRAGMCRIVRESIEKTLIWES